MAPGWREPSALLSLESMGGHCLRATLLIALASALTIEHIEPREGSSRGGNRVTLSGRGFPFFAREIAVSVQGKPCSDVRIVRPFRSLSCVVPACLRCGAAQVRMTAAAITDASLPPAPPGSSPVASSSIGYTYLEPCYTGAAPLLPARSSREESCLLCRHMVALAVAAVGDASGNQALRAALRAICSTTHFLSFGRTSELFCRTDLSAACSAMFYTESSTVLADAIWDVWEEYYLYGDLPAAACARISRCDSVLPR